MRPILPLLIAVPWVTAACATAPPEPTNATRADAPPPARAKKRKKKDVPIPEFAARLRDDLECERVVTEMAKRSEKVAWALLETCVKQDKFRNLRLLLEERWRRRLEQEKPWDRYRLLAHVLAIRGGDFSSDLPILRGAGVTLLDLAGAMKAKKTEEPVVFRGLVRARRLEPDGRVLLRIAEVGLTTNRFRGRRYERRAFTGREVEARVGDLPLLVREGNEFVFLALIRSVRSQDEAEIRVVDVFRKGVILPDGGLSAP